MIPLSDGSDHDDAQAPSSRVTHTAPSEAAPVGAASPKSPTKVGLVAGTEDSTPLKFHVAITSDAYLQLDDVVVAKREVPGLGQVTTSGVVTEVTSRHEGAQFGSDVFLISNGVMPAQVQEIAEVTTTRVDPECFVPPRPGALAERATGQDREAALYFDKMLQKVPVGTGRDGEPIYLNFEFLDGTRGAHVSISGISGVATKTSFALWLLHSIFTGGALGSRSINSRALIFSVKGEDLLFLDQQNSNLDDELTAVYAKLGVPASPFESAQFFSPPLPDDTTGRPNVTGRTKGVDAFWWTLQEFCHLQLLPFVFADSEDEKSQYTMVVHQVTGMLRRFAKPAGNDGAVSIDGQTARTYEDLVDLICEKIDPPPTDDEEGEAEDQRVKAEWAGRAVGSGTINAFIRRLRSSQRALGPIIRGDLVTATDRPVKRVVKTDGHQITVVDLHSLPERAQRFVVGVVLAQETERKEKAGSQTLLFTMIDELNKYAPREGSSPIKEVLLDIAERGRSLGIILIGAQQTASEVERRIVSNSSIKIVGRLDPAEAGRPEYGFLPASQRQRATLARPGTMFVSQPEIPVPLAVEFPFPAWATRASEVADARDVSGARMTQAGSGADPFARVGDQPDDLGDHLDYGPSDRRPARTRPPLDDGGIQDEPPF